ncbi:ABC transporter permease [Arthrobacter sp. RT-1]|uniref:ABC transporter permease n=1 Tax=Arthrobacter sp. RT-1 TaxID=2292263 RepID=UPI000E1ED827|nr:ABC transporter permease [Arthrobacter sp. RT-1]RDV10003.1 ABC transporter permease [Arthrobacter sp. RT-1]
MTSDTLSPAQTTHAPPARQMTWTRFRAWVLEVPALQVLVVLALAAWLLTTMPAMANPRSITSILVITSLLALAAMGQTLVVILGGLDLAAPGYILFGAFMAANVAGKLALPAVVALLITALVCGGIGALIGWICHRFAVQPLIVTLGTGAAITGATLFFADGDYSSAPPVELRSLASLRGATFGLPFPPIILIVLLCGAGMWIFLNRTAAGRRFRATGINFRAAGLTRIRTSAVWTAVFAASGALAGVAGVFIASFGSGWSQTIGEPYLFSGLAAVLVGGTIFGSIRGSYTRTLLGALILTLLSTIIVSNGLTEAQSRIVFGIIILAVVSLYGRERHVRDRF